MPEFDTYNFSNYASKIMNYARPIDAPLNSILSGLQFHIDSHSTVDGLQWPDDAYYLVKYRLKAWPCDYRTHTRFFANTDELSAWHASLVEWSRFEDNYFEFDALYMWDLGPVLLEDVRPHIAPAVNFLKVRM